MARYDMTEFEWKVIQPLLSNTPRGVRHAPEKSWNSIVQASAAPQMLSVPFSSPIARRDAERTTRENARQ
jgi:hypothetical protein